MIFGTVIHTDGLARAIMMAKSIKKQMPCSKVIIGIMEESMPHAASKCPYFDETLLMKNTSAYSNMRKFFFQYTFQEAQRACKALLTSYIYKKYTNEDTIIYLDADTWVISPFDELTVSNQHPITLIGKVTNPEVLDLDGLTDVRKNGIYDSSLMSFKRHPVSEKFLNCWSKLCEHNCYYDRTIHQFIDQDWLDLAHTLFDGVYTLRHSGYQVSPSNLMERWNIEKTTPLTYSIDNQPLRSIRFSHDFLLATSWINPDRGEIYDSLFHEYSNELKEMDQLTISGSLWSYGAFSSGEAVTDQTKQKYRRYAYDNPEIENPFLLSNAYFSLEHNNVNAAIPPVQHQAKKPGKRARRRIVSEKGNGAREKRRYSRR